MSGFWLWLSDSVSWWGVGLVMLLATALVAARQSGLKARVSKGLLFIASLCAVIGAVAAVNEFGIKRAVAAHRPYVKMLDGKGLLSADKYYAQPSRTERAIFLKKALEKFNVHPVVKSLDPKIREHWGVLTGYSFPSGHAVIAFLFATILAFVIENLIPNGRRLVWIPFLWASGICLSRVAVGAHSELDVTVGGLFGGAVGILFLMSGRLENVLPPPAPSSIEAGE